MTLESRLLKSLDYYQTEFPKEKYPEVWNKPMGYCDGITPNDLIEINLLRKELRWWFNLSEERLDALNKMREDAL